MIWLILLTLVTYGRSLLNKGISDDLPVNSEHKAKGYIVGLKDILADPFEFIQSLVWRLFKENNFLHHLFSMVIFMGLVCSFYIVAQKYIPQNIAFLASMFFAVHPCNAQVAAWSSGRWYAVVSLIGLWALHIDSVAVYLLSFFTISTLLPLPLLMDIPIVVKIVSILLAVFISFRILDDKVERTKNEGAYKPDNLKIYPRKAIVCLKSFTYYFTLALFPIRMSWFHEIGEPIDDKLKSFDFHAFISLLLVGSMCLFIGKPAFLGLMIFALFIFPFSNIITIALFTSERYMTPAIMGWSIFLAYVLVSYPVVAAVLIALYFLRTQLELWAYKDDFTLALSSLLNFPTSGFAWSNMVNIFLHDVKPSAAFDTIKAGLKLCPTFPTLYYQLYLDMFLL